MCTSLTVDNQYGYIWMIVRGIGLVVYNFNQTPLDDTDDEYALVTTSNGNGSLPSSYVNTIAIDLDGVIYGLEQITGLFNSTALIPFLVNQILMLKEY